MTARQYEVVDDNAGVVYEDDIAPLIAVPVEQAFETLPDSEYHW